MIEEAYRPINTTTTNILQQELSKIKLMKRASSSDKSEDVNADEDVSENDEPNKPNAEANSSKIITAAASNFALYKSPA